MISCAILLAASWFAVPWDVTIKLCHSDRTPVRERATLKVESVDGEVLDEGVADGGVFSTTVDPDIHAMVKVRVTYRGETTHKRHEAHEEIKHIVPDQVPIGKTDPEVLNRLFQ